MAQFSSYADERGASLRFDKSYDASAEDTCLSRDEWVPDVRLRDDARTKDIARLIEDLIIPGLYLAHRAPAPQTAQIAKPPARWTVESFTQFVLDARGCEIAEETEGMIAAGVPLAEVYTSFLAAAARNLGEWWLQDRCSFADVTLGVAKLHHVLHALGQAGGVLQAAPPGREHSIFLAPAPGEQHTFGLSMIEELFFQAGWQVLSDHRAMAEDIARAAATADLDVVGISIGCKEHVDAVSRLVIEVRRASRNASVAFLMGGRVFQDCPEMESAFEGVTVVKDGMRAVEFAESIVASRRTQGAALEH